MKSASRNAAAWDLATLSCMFGAMSGFFHGVRICESEGLKVNEFSQMIGAISPVLGEMIKMALTHLKPGPDSLLPVTITMPGRLLEPEQVTALLAPFTGRDLPPQEALLDCAGLTHFSLEALGLLAERTADLFNITTLVGASTELAEAFTDDAQAEAIRHMKHALMARRRAERERREGRG